MLTMLGNGNCAVQLDSKGKPKTLKRVGNIVLKI